jgi:protein-L-isoaspartate(D-aspartate) O-methyltransferase
MNVEQARFNMVQQQIRPWDVSDARVLELLATLRREDFVPMAHKALAFVDMEIPLLADSDAALRSGKVMLAPRVEARLLQDASLQPHETVLEIGSGSGYMAALLAARAQHVVSLEIDPELARMARTNLRNAGVNNADVREADGAAGTQPEGSFDVIVLSGSVAEVPSNLLAQLKVGGRLIGIVGNEPVMRATLVTRTSDTGFSTAEPWDCNAPRLAHFPAASKFRF